MTDGSEIPEAAKAETAEPDLRVRVYVERGDKLSIIRAVSLAPKTGAARERDRGPFGASIAIGAGPERAELLDELRRTASARTRVVTGMAVSRRDGSWGPFAVSVLTPEVPLILAALRALFDDDDPEPLKTYIRRPPELPRGEPWSSPDPR